MNEDDIHQLLNHLAENCTCTTEICLYCQAEETIDALLIQVIINHYRKKRRTIRCPR